MSTEQLEQIDIDFLILANHAEMVNGLLYMVGVGWDRRSANPNTPFFSIAAGFLIPWNLTNRHDHRGR